MNLSALKTFAPAVRKQLIEAVTRKLDFVLTGDTADLRAMSAQRESLRRESTRDRQGLVERVAYTWFNRFAALRFIDAHGWHPFGARVLTAATADETQPELLRLARSGQLPADLVPHTDPDRLNRLLDGALPSTNPQGEVYRHLVLAACRFYHTVLPVLFEKLDDDTELLLPDDLLTEHSVVHGFRTEIADADCAEVEILGWLYQFYISEKKDQVMARKSAVPTEDIPAVTQLFTPHWIVRYLVENSLGRLWLLNRPQSRLRAQMPYYIEEVGGGQSAVGSERWAVSSGQPAGAGKIYANQELSRPVGLAESHGPGGSGVSTLQAIPQGGGLRADGSVAPRPGVDSVEYCRGGGAQQPGGIQPLPEHSPWLLAGSGDSTADCATPELPLGLRPQDRDGVGLGGGTVDPRAAAQPGTLTAHCPPPPADFLRIEKPEDIRLIDPAAGSGHMLTYAFDLLYAIYEEEGYAPSDIPALILRHNLHGVEICERAAALAAFALCMKARSRDNRFFRRVVQPQVIALQDVRYAEGELADYFRVLQLDDSILSLSGSDTPRSALRLPQLSELLRQFEEAKTFGSLIQPCLTESEIQSARSQIEDRQSRIENAEGQLFLRETHLRVLRVLDQAETLTQRYHIVVANPPYMTGGMNDQLSAKIVDAYNTSRSDLSATFITRSRRLCMPNGLCALVTMHSWMFLTTSLGDFRKDLLRSCSILNLAHHGIGAFPTLNSKVVQTVAFVLCLATPKQDHIPICFRLLDYNPELKEQQLLNRERRFANLRQADFSKIEGWPLAYWISQAILDSFQQSAIRTRYTLKEGLGTRNDPYFMRCFWEVSCNRTISPQNINAKWLRTDKAGLARKWFGNLYAVMNWENDGAEIKNYRNPDGTLKSRPQNTQFFFREAVTWGKVGTIAKTFRYRDSTFAFNDAAPSAFGENLDYILALLNSKVFDALLEIQGDTMNVTLGVVGVLPFIIHVSKVDEIAASSRQCVQIARADWDNFETSWDFRVQPLLRPGLKSATIETSWRNWEAQSNAAIRRMQELETENNRLFISAYGLQDELQPEVPEEQITLARADMKKDMAAFLSYAIGCMMGRYSLDAPGLILADAGATLDDYVRIVAEKIGGSRLSAVGSERASPDTAPPPPTADCPPPTTFTPDADGILPVLDGEWFQDDIVGRVREFLRVTFGEETLNENVRFIEASLGKDLRKYFLSDFYKSHLQVYKKRPIYWLFRSPKGGFAVLVYLHRMKPDTPNLILRYLRDYLLKLQARIEYLDHAQATASTARDKTAARKESDQLKKTLRECEDWERDVLLPLAQSRPELDLDDGVKVNYLKLGEALAPIAGLAAKEEE